MLNNYDKKRNQMLQATVVEKDHRKMYKAGKNWLIASIAAVSFGLLGIAAPGVGSSVVSASDNAPVVQQDTVSEVNQSASVSESKTDATTTQTVTHKTDVAAAVKTETPTLTATAAPKTDATKANVAGAKAVQPAGDATKTGTAAPVPDVKATTGTHTNATLDTAAKPEQTTQLGSATVKQVAAAKTAAAKRYAQTGTPQKVTASDPAVVTGTINMHYINELTGQPITFHVESSDKSELISGEKTFTTDAADPTQVATNTEASYLIPARGYQIVTKKSDLPRNFAAGTTDVNVKYLPLSDVVAQIVDQTTGKVLFQQVLSGKTQLGYDPETDNPADAYDVSYLKMAIPGFIYVSTDGNEKGQFNQTQQLTDPSKPYDATTNPIKPNAIVVTFNYKPVATDMTPAETDSSIVPIGSNGTGHLAAGLPGYTDTPYDFTNQLNDMAKEYESGGKTLIAVAGDPKGTMSIQGENLVYVFADNVPVYVNYLDQTNKKVMQQIVMGNDGTIPKGNYQTEQKSFAGYTFARVTGQTSGAFGPFGRVVNYYYTKDPAPTYSTTPWTPTTPVIPTTPGTTTTPETAVTPTTPVQTGLPATFGGSDGGSATSTPERTNRTGRTGLPSTFGKTTRLTAQNGRGRGNRQMASDRETYQVATGKKTTRLAQGETGTAQTKRASFPQTGDSHNASAVVAGIGLAIVSVLGLFGLADHKRRMN